MSIKEEKYKFNQILSGLTAFIAGFEKRLNEIDMELPVFVLDSGDETYIFKEKFEITTEKYMKVPRAIISVDDASFNTDQDTNQYIKFSYLHNEKQYKAQFRRKATNFPIVCNLVCSNFIKALEYMEIIISILSIDNVFTYDFLGNNYQGSFNLTSVNLEKNSMEVGGTKNYVVKTNIDLQLQLMIVRYNTIQEYTGDLVNEFDINAENNIETYKTKLKPNDT